MKIVFFLVVLANLMLFLWESNRNVNLPVDKQYAVVSPDEREMIVLESELPKDQNDEAIKDGESQTGSVSLANSGSVVGKPLPASNKLDPGQESSNTQTTAKTSDTLNLFVTCYKVGPFADENRLDSWNKQATADDLETKPLTIEEKALSVFLVYYPAAKNPEQTTANMQMLKSKGLADVWLVDRGEEKGMISLGIFSREERALMLKNQLRAKGIHAEIKPRYKAKLVKYLVVKGGRDLKDRLKTLNENYPSLIAKPVQNCLLSKSGN